MGWQYFNSQLYLFQRRLPAVVLGCTDFIGRWTVGKFINRNKVLDKTQVRKILVCRPDHLGDVIMTTAVLPLLRQIFPGAQIHMLIGGWSREIVADNIDVAELIEFDHFYLNRENKPSWKKCLKMLAQIPRVVRKLRMEKYDLGIAFRPFFGNAILLMWLGGVKYRVGYAAAGFGFLLHKTGTFSLSMHFIENMRQLLKNIDAVAETAELRPQLKVSETAQQQVQKLLLQAGIDRQKNQLVVFHPGSGRKEALWDVQKWAALADIFQERYHVKVVITGGVSERNLAEEIINRMKTKAVHFADVFSIAEFTALISLSSLVVALESFSSHISAALNIPTIVLHSGIQDLCLWKPWGQRVIPLTKKTACAPCWQKRGCTPMECIKDIQVNDVAEFAEELLS